MADKKAMADRRRTKPILRTEKTVISRPAGENENDI